MTKITQKRRKAKVSRLSVAIFEYYFDSELQPLRKRLQRQYERLSRLYQKDLTELSDRERKHIQLLETEVNELYQTFVATDGLKILYMEYLEQLTLENQFHQQRAENNFEFWMQAITRAGKAESLLNFLTDAERRELDRRRDQAQFEQLCKTLGL